MFLKSFNKTRTIITSFSGAVLNYKQNIWSTIERANEERVKRNQKEKKEREKYRKENYPCPNIRTYNMMNHIF